MIEKLNADLDRAAYYSLYGAKLISVGGQIGRFTLVMEIPKGMYDAIKAQPLVDYRDYMTKRKRLKEKCRKAFGQSLGINKQNYNKQLAKKKYQ